MSQRSKHNDPYDYLLPSDDGAAAAVEKILDGLSEDKRRKEAPVPAPAPLPEAEEIPQFADKDAEIFYYEQRTAEEVRQYLRDVSSGSEEIRNQARDYIKSAVSAWQLKYVNSIKYYPLSREEKHIIRMDYYGSIDEPVRIPGRSKSTAAYLRFVNSPYRPRLENPQYNLDTSPSWNLFRQFPRFRKIEGSLLEQLAAMNIPPEMLPHMNAYDFADVLYRRFQDTADDYGKVRIFTGARRSFIKDFIRNNEKQFRAYLRRTQVDDRYADALIEMMHKKGTTNNIDVYDKAKAAALLRKYQQKGIIPAHEEIGENLTSQQLELIKMQGDYPSVAVLDDNGKPLSGPAFTVHHKIAVKDAGEATYLADVNHFENLCLTVEDPYHRLLHSLDRTEISNFRESYKARIYMNNPNLVFWGGFDRSYHIHYDYSRDPRSRRLMENNYKWIAEHLSQIKPQPDIDPELVNAAVYANKLSRRQKKEKEKQERLQQRSATAARPKTRKPKEAKKENNAPLPQPSSPAKTQKKNEQIKKRLLELKEKNKDRNHNYTHPYAGQKRRNKAEKIKNIIDSLYRHILQREEQNAAPQPVPVPQQPAKITPSPRQKAAAAAILQALIESKQK